MLILFVFSGLTMQQQTNNWYVLLWERPPLLFRAFCISLSRINVFYNFAYPFGMSVDFISFQLILEQSWCWDSKEVACNINWKCIFRANCLNLHILQSCFPSCSTFLNHRDGVFFSCVHLCGLHSSVFSLFVVYKLFYICCKEKISWGVKTILICE